MADALVGNRHLIARSSLDDDRVGSIGHPYVTGISAGAWPRSELLGPGIPSVLIDDIIDG